MNVERITQLIDHLNNLPDEEFGMADYYNHTKQDIEFINTSSPLVYVHECSTPSCIAGHANFLFGTEDERVNTNPTTLARQLLDIDRSDSYNLFMPTNRSVYACTSKQAARVLQDFLDTEHVDWDIIINEETGELIDE